MSDSFSCFFWAVSEHTLDTPRAGAGAEIQDVLGVFADGRVVQAVTHGGDDGEVFHVLPGNR